MGTSDLKVGAWYTNDGSGIFPYYIRIIHIQNTIVYFLLYAGNTPTDKFKMSSDEFCKLFYPDTNKGINREIGNLDLSDFVKFNPRALV